MNGNKKYNNVDPVDIKTEIYLASRRITTFSNQIFILAKNAAEAESKYRKALAAEIMKLREQQLPVTLINEVARGNISDLKLERDLAEFKYQAARDSIKAIQSQLSALQSILRTQEEITKV